MGGTGRRMVFSTEGLPIGSNTTWEAADHSIDNMA